VGADDRAVFDATTTLLEAAGIPIIGNRDEPRVRAECTRLARRLHLSGKHTFGLIPVDVHAAVPAAAVQLGVALMDLSGSTVAYLDANTHWPLFGDSTGERAGNGQSSPFVTKWLFESLALLVPSTPTRAADAVPALEAQLQSGRGLFQYVIVDLTGFDGLGELEGAMELLDLVLLVARSASTRENELLELHARMPAKKTLGLLLVD
jgi:hypothetical protein